MKTRNHRILPAQALLLAAAMLLMILGIQNGEAQTVLAKAVNICLECIGIG